MKYWALLRIAFKDRMASPADVLARSLFFGAVIFLFSRLWSAIGTGAPGGAGASSRELVWYLFITEAIVLSLPPLTELVDRDIQTGDIAYSLIRPLDYLASRSMAYLGDVGARFLVNAGMGALFAALFVGLPDRAAGIPLALPLVLGAFLIHLAISLAISMLGFWVEDTLPFFWIYSKASFILGGLFMPIDFYPPWMRTVCRFFPLRDGVYSVAQAALGLGAAVSPAWILARQCAWTAGGLTLAALMFRVGVRRLEAQGG